MNKGSTAGRDPGGVRVSIPIKIFLGYALVTTLFGAVLIYNFSRSSQLYSNLTVVNQGVVSLRLTLSRVEGDLQGYYVLLSESDPVVLRSALQASQVLFPYTARITESLEICGRHARVLRRPELARRYDQEFTRIDEALTVLGTLADALSEESGLLERVLERSAGGDVGLIDTSRGSLTDTIAEMQGEIEGLVRLMNDILSDVLTRSSEQKRVNSQVVGLSTAIAMGIALLIMLWAARSLRPLTRLSEGVQQLRAGTYATVDVVARNEIGLLAHEFNEMVRALKARDQSLREQQEALERAYQTALAAERLAAVGRLSSQITHEIRNPLSSIGLNIELLEEELDQYLDAESEPRQLMRAITTEIDRLNAIAEDYLRLARLPKPRKADEDLNALIEQLIQFHRPEFHQAGVSVELTLERPAPHARLDAAQIRQALLNLVRNALDVMRQGGTLQIVTRQVDHDVEIVVSDDGPGIPHHLVERVFDPFYSTKTRGTGLGLPLARQIAQQHGGDLVLDEERGQGAHFRLTLPREEDDGWEPPEEDDGWDGEGAT